MQCPKCSSNDHRAMVTNSQLPDQIVRKRRCQACQHCWFTVEAQVPDYAVGWSALHLRKPVLRVPMELRAGATRLRLAPVEAKDQVAGLRAANERRSAAAEARHRIVTAREPTAA